MTGAAADDWSSEGVPNSILLKKPFAPAQLVTAVSQLLKRLADFWVIRRFCVWQIVLQKSKVATARFFRENLKRKEVDNSHSLSRTTEVAHEFGARR